MAQTVLDAGQPKMRMKSNLNAGGAKVSFRLTDLREIDAETLLQSGSAGDLVLAMLATGGTEKLTEIARRSAELNGPSRFHVLSGVRKLSGRLRMEMRTMGSLQTFIQENEILREVYDDVMAKGEAKGEARGKAEGEAVGMLKLLRGQLRAKFGRVPKWADERLENANRAQLERWSKKFINTGNLEDVIGRK